MSQLLNLTRPFPPKYVHKKPGKGGGTYVEHGTVEQALLATVGPFSFSVKQVLRGHVPESTTAKGEVRPELHDALVGVVAALTVTVDGRTVTVEEVGDCGDPQNWDHDGQRGKDAMSDAIKRCAMRLGCGLHLWAGEEYFLHDSLLEKQIRNEDPSGEDGHGTQGEPATAVAPATHETPVQPGPQEQAEEASPGKGVSSADPVVSVKRAQFKKLCREAKPKLIAERVAFDAYGKNLDELDESQLDELIGPMTGKVNV